MNRHAYSARNDARKMHEIKVAPALNYERRGNNLQVSSARKHARKVHNEMRGLEVELRHELDAVVGDPMQVGVSQAVGIEGSGFAVLNGSDLVLQAQLELANRVEQGRTQTPHAVHVVCTGEIVVQFTIQIRINQCLFSAEVTDITGKEDTLEFLRMFVFLLTNLTAINEADP